MSEKMFSYVFFSMMPPYDVNLMYIKVVEFKTAYLLNENYLEIHSVSLEKN